MIDSSSLPTISESISSNDNRIRSTKRKLDDAFQILDSAVSPSTVPDGPPPPKRSNTMRSSLYSTLAKYGIKSPNHPSLSESSIPNAKSTPHLTAILSRAASRTKSTFSFKFSSQSHNPAPILPLNAEYRPSSLLSFLSRLATYKLSTYANKPPSIDAVAASKCGWINDGKDRLVCGLCNASWVVASREGLNRDAANTLVERQRMSLVEGHKPGCPWRTRQCDDSIYCIPLHSSAAMIQDVKANAITMDSMIRDILIKHPLTTSQLNALHSTVTSYSQPPLTRMNAGQSPIPTPATTTEPSETAILASLFGWTLVSPATPQVPLRRVSSSRANSVVPSVPPSPSLSRTSSISLPRTPPKLTRQSTEISFRLLSNLGAKPENALLQCELCQRRIGLWTFSARIPEDEPDSSMTDTNADLPSTPAPRLKKPLPRRSFDLLKEHRSYCPYVVRSTVIPSLPVPQTPATPGRSTGSNGRISSSSLSHFNGRNGASDTLEGWRAVLTVVLRYGLSQKQRVEYNFLAPKVPTQEGEQDPDTMDVDNVKAMVTGVKARGGKDLLKYVRGLLG